MNQIYPDAGLVQWLQRMAVGNFHFHLFVNNLVPNKTTLLAGLTEAAWAGYAAITVNAADFALTGVAGHVGTILAAPIAFTNGSAGSQSAYGYYVTDTADAILFAVALFDAAPVAKIVGDSWIITPVIGDFSQF